MVFDGAADAAVGEVEPFGGGAGAGGDGEGELKVGCVAEFFEYPLVNVMFVVLYVAIMRFEGVLGCVSRFGWDLCRWTDRLG